MASDIWLATNRQRAIIWNSSGVNAHLWRFNLKQLPGACSRMPTIRNHAYINVPVKAANDKFPWSDRLTVTVKTGAWYHSPGTIRHYCIFFCSNRSRRSRSLATAWHHVAQIYWLLFRNCAQTHGTIICIFHVASENRRARISLAISKTSPSIRHRSDTLSSDRCLIDVDPKVLAIRAASETTHVFRGNNGVMHVSNMN